MNIKKLMRTLLTAIFIFVGTKNVFANNNEYIKNITINNNGGHVGIGKKEIVNLNVDMYNTHPNFDGEIIWTTSDKKIATIEKNNDKKATITGVSDGNVIIKACVKDVEQLCSSVSLAVGGAEKQSVKDFRIDSEPYSIHPGDRESIKVEVDNNKGTFKGATGQSDFITWESTDRMVASVVWQSEQHAKIHGGSKKGTAVIYGCTSSGVCAATQVSNKGESTYTTEHEERVNGIIVNKSIVNVKVGDVERINVDYTGEKNKILDEDKINLVYNSNPKNALIENSSDGCISVTKVDKNTFEVRAFKYCSENPKLTLSLSTNKDINAKVEIRVNNVINKSLNVDGTTTGKKFDSSDTDFIEDSKTEFSCEGLLDKDLKDVLQLLLKWVRIGAPIALIVLVTVDFSSAVISNDQDAIKKATNKAIKRGIAAIALFFIPLIVSIMISWLDESDYFNPDRVNCEEVYK